jgi:hypothetical protein
MKKPNINKAFRALQKAGYFARQNFLCCQNCGWHAMTDEQAEKAFFYHRQDADGLKKDGYCHVAWSGDGEEIAKILKECGVPYKWDGTKNKRFMIFIEEPKE